MRNLFFWCCFVVLAFDNTYHTETNSGGLY